jgi:hypothetical protein
MERKTFSFAHSIEKREVENIGHKITITVDDITDDIMPLFEKSVKGDIKAKLEMYRKIYDRQVKERSRRASEQDMELPDEDTEFMQKVREQERAFANKR